jgi:hypothetical protein
MYTLLIYNLINRTEHTFNVDALNVEEIHGHIYIYIYLLLIYNLVNQIATHSSWILSTSRKADI